MKTQPDHPSEPNRATDPTAGARPALLWGAGPAMAFGLWVYALAPAAFELVLGWAGIRTLLLVALCSLIQFGCAALPRGGWRITLGIAGWLASATALFYLIAVHY